MKTTRCGAPTLLGVGALLLITGCIVRPRHEAHALIAAGTNTPAVLALVGSPPFPEELRHEAGLAAGSVRAIWAKNFRDTTLVEIRVAAADDRTAMLATETALSLLRKKYAAADGLPGSGLEIVEPPQVGY